MTSIKTIAILASAMTMAFSCSERVSDEKPTVPGSLTINALIDGTRTTTGSDFKLSWTDKDLILVASRDSVDLNSPGWGETKPAEFVYDSGTSVFRSAAAIPAGTYVYALYSGNSSQNERFRMSSKASPRYEILAEQTQGKTDALGSLCINDPLAGSAEIAGAGSTTTLQMHHLFSLMKVTLVNGTGAPMMVKSLTMTADEYLAGIYELNFNAPVPFAGSCSEGHKAVRVSLPSDVSIPSEGKYDFYFLIAPMGNYSGRISLQAASSSGRTYTRSINASRLNFEAGALNKTNFTVSEADPGEFKLYSGELTEGDYIITGYSKESSGETTTYAMVNKIDSNRLKYTSVTAVDDEIKTNDESIIWHIAKSGSYWTIYSAAADSYASSTGVDNKAQLLSSGTSDYALWSVSGTSTYTFVNKYNNEHKRHDQLRNNSTYGFATYGSGTGDLITLYKLEGSGGAAGKKAAATLSGVSATGISKSGATLSATYSDCSSMPTEAGFQWGTSAEALDNSVSATVSSTFSAYLSGLKAETTYWFRPFVKVFGTGEYSSEFEIFYGETTSFTTLKESSQETTNVGWLSLFEVPACNASLPEGKTFSSTVSEKYGSTKAYVCETTSSTQKIVTHTFSYNGKVNRTYTMLFDKDKKCALWSCYAMHNTAFKDCGVGRKNGWCYDPALPQSWQPDLSGAYSGGYSRGHQVASNDRQTTAEENKQTFYYSNMTPQLSGLNSAGWNTLEQKIQSLGNGTSGRDTLYIVTGPIFDTGYTTCKDDSGTVCPVPTKYYKCLMKCSFDASGKATSAVAAGYYFVHASGAARVDVSVDVIEAMTGFDFFTNVPKSIQNQAEASLYKFF